MQKVPISDLASVPVQQSSDSEREAAQDKMSGVLKCKEHAEKEKQYKESINSYVTRSMLIEGVAEI